MEKAIPVLFVVICLSISSSAFARGGYYNHRHHSYYHGKCIGVAELATGILLGAVITYALLPPPRAAYVSQYEVYQPEVVYQPKVVVQHPRVCVEERVVSGEWQQSP